MSKSLERRLNLDGEDLEKEFDVVLAEFMQLPSTWKKYTRTQDKLPPIKSKQASAWYSYQGLLFFQALSGNDHQWTVSLTRDTLNKIEGQPFSEHDKRILRISYLRHLSIVYGQWAVLGESDKNLTDPLKRTHLKQEIYFDMLSDLERGEMTHNGALIAFTLFDLGEDEKSRQVELHYFGGERGFNIPR